MLKAVYDVFIDPMKDLISTDYLKINYYVVSTEISKAL